jgi:hypothetical protein
MVECTGFEAWTNFRKSFRALRASLGYKKGNCGKFMLCVSVFGLNSHWEFHAIVREKNDPAFAKSLKCPNEAYS